MTRTVRTTTAALATGWVLLGYAGENGAQPALETGPDAEVTVNGLHRVDRRIIDAAWVRPDLNLKQYTKILLMPAVVSFREVSDRKYWARYRSEEQFPVSDQNKALFATSFGESFSEYVAQVKPYEISEDAGRNVLMVQGFLLDVISDVPPDLPGSSGVFVRRPWEASVVLELRDSMSDTVLARTVDRQRVDGFFDVGELPNVTRLTMQNWSNLLRSRIEELLEIGGGRWSHCQEEDVDCTL